MDECVLHLCTTTIYSDVGVQVICYVVYEYEYGLVFCFGLRSWGALLECSGLLQNTRGRPFVAIVSFLPPPW